MIFVSIQEVVGFRVFANLPSPIFAPKIPRSRALHEGAHALGLSVDERELKPSLE